MDTIFKVDGKPFFPIGGQSMNSSPYKQEDINVFWKALEVMHGNTGEVPIYWEAVEPEEDRYDFTLVDSLIHSAREKNFKLIFLWFGTWKNGTMKYSPAWVKKDTARFKRVISHDGFALSVLSTHCKANFDADSKAFCAVMEHIKQVDGKEGTVIAMQVENEPGIIGRSSRDHGPEAENQFRSPVPTGLLEVVKGKSDSPTHAIWKQYGAKSMGNWTEIFGGEASELFTAWSIASYIDGIAEAGKKVLDLPMYTNVWLDKQGWNMAGLDYPCGGAVPKTLDIWKWAAPNLDIISPDIYIGNPEVYSSYCSAYDREDNALFIPESDCRRGYNNWLNMFYALGKYHAIGYFSFGIEHVLLQDGTVNPKYATLVGSFRSASSVLPLLLKYRGTGKIHTVIQCEQILEQRLDLGDYKGLVLFGYDRTDFLHRYPGMDQERGCGLVIQTGDNEFYVLGTGFTVSFRKMYTEVDYAENKLERCNNYLTVEEGRFGSNGEWICSRIRSGDESDSGIWVYNDVGAVRVIICD